MYYDRGEFFSEFSPSAGGGFNGPFGVTLAPPFVSPHRREHGRDFRRRRSAPPLPPRPPGSAAAFQAPSAEHRADRIGNFPAGNLFGPFLFGGYDINNKLPYTENWTLRSSISGVQ